MKKLLVVLFVFLVSLAAASATVIWDTEPTLTMDEDTPLTVDLSDYVDITSQTGDIVYSIKDDSSAEEVSIVLDGSVVTLTPDADWNGDGGTVKFEIDDEDTTPAETDDLTITVDAVNDAPTWSLNDEYLIEEDEEFELIVANFVEDVDEDLLSFTAEIDSDLDIDDDYTWDAVNGIFTLTEDVGPGIYTVTFTADDDEADLVNKDVDFIVISDDCLCEEGVKGKVEIQDIDFDEDDFQPGETVDLEIEIGNTDNEDLDVTVEVFFYDMTEGDKILDAEEEIEIEEDDEEVFEFELELPVEELDPSHEYTLFIKAYEDEDDHCDEESTEIEIELEDHKVIIESFTLDKSTVEAGELVEAKITIRNIGKEDEDVIIKLKESDLSLNKKLEEFELEEYDDGDDDDSVDTKIIRFTVPTTVGEGSYSVEAIVEYDGGDEIESKFAALTVKTLGSDVEVDVESLPELKEGQTYSLSVKVTNKGSSLVAYIATVEGAWFGSVDSQVVTLTAGETKTVNFVLDVTESGSQTGKVVIKDDSETLTTKEFTADVAEGGFSGITGAFAGAFSDSSAFWVIGDIVLVIIAIFFLKLIFSSGKKRPIEEIKL